MSGYDRFYLVDFDTQMTAIAAIQSTAPKAAPLYPYCWPCAEGSTSPVLSARPKCGIATLTRSSRLTR